MISLWNYFPLFQGRRAKKQQYQQFHHRTKKGPGRLGQQHCREKAIERRPDRYCSVMVGGDYAYMGSGVDQQDFHWECYGGSRRTIRNKRKLLGTRF